MKKVKHILKVWLKKNELTPDKKDSIAVVSSPGSIDKAGLIDDIKNDGFELAPETFVLAVTLYNSRAAEFVAKGYSVDTGLVYLRPIVTGAFYGKKFDKEVNGIYISATQGVEIRNALADTEVEVLGDMPDLINVYQVVNMQTKIADGTLARGRNAQIEGTYIKVVGDNDTVGLYLENIETGVSRKLEDDLIVINNPSKLLILVPTDLTEGVYRLKIITQFTGAGRLLNTPRQTVFDQELTVV
jgi:hypothetical protein